ncbi:uncharacterized protein PHACADRAFT_252603 [Phanerochaete carnosa HHB-10118-sp]|uniref:Uncharacterized protein n=1 Tax=Phanerochaete carnosa (strain HHB-10118-sp) TaxID=650164 RepID=K5W3C2_PHACS|nr:uncharacterized protein PHACADRAFT_252603 [Phanerochaete carnosa HHB-10118-sp]EKM58348.1 hypothetical protein PHACADRAFT_252603 [Phanerochaete carnosa HHB-10118-sp]
MAAKLPSELVVEILTEIAWKLPDNPLYIENDLAQEDKDQLAVCSLVCRYWAKRCRPHLLSHLTIRSSDELDQLHHCLNAASPIRDVPSFSRCMRFLTMVHTGEWAVPWYHNIFGMIVQHDIILNRWKAGTVLELRSAFTGPGCSLEATNGYAPHSFSVGLPRTIPTSMLMIQRLVLSDMRFCAVSHMLRLAFNITQLKELACIRTTFTEELIDLAALPPVTRVGHQQHYAPEVAAIEACGTNDFEVHLMLAIMSSSGTVSRNARVARQVARSRAVAAMHKIVLALRPALQNGRKFEQRFGSCTSVQ